MIVPADPTGREINMWTDVWEKGFKDNIYDFYHSHRRIGDRLAPGQVFRKLVVPPPRPEREVAVASPLRIAAPSQDPPAVAPPQVPRAVAPPRDPRTHSTAAQSKVPPQQRSVVGDEEDEEEDDEEEEDEEEEEYPATNTPVCSYDECAAKCTNRGTNIEMCHVCEERTVHMECISNVRRFTKFMQYYEHLRGVPVCYHCACTAASQEVRNRTSARYFPQRGGGGGKGLMKAQQKAADAAQRAAAKRSSAASAARGTTTAKRGRR